MRISGRTKRTSGPKILQTAGIKRSCIRTLLLGRNTKWGITSNTVKKCHFASLSKYDWIPAHDSVYSILKISLALVVCHKKIPMAGESCGATFHSVCGKDATRNFGSSKLHLCHKMPHKKTNKAQSWGWSGVLSTNRWWMWTCFF